MKPLFIECPNLTCIINQSQPECFITHIKTFNLPMLLLTAFLLLSLACLLLSPSMKMGGRKITPNIALIIAHWDIW